MRPSETVVLPSFWRVAAMKTRGVEVFMKIKNAKLKIAGRSRLVRLAFFNF
jgi:predicted aspartyl protease